MKRKLQSLLLVLVATIFGSALLYASNSVSKSEYKHFTDPNPLVHEQSFQLVYNGIVLKDGATLDIAAIITDLTEFMPDYYIVEAKTNDAENALNIHNLTNDVLSATITVEVLEDVEGTAYSLCAFGDCFPVRGGRGQKTGNIAVHGEAETGWDVTFTHGMMGTAKTKLTVTSGEYVQTVWVNFVYEIQTEQLPYDFQVDGIYYNIISSTDNTVAVTYMGNAWNSYLSEYSGVVTIPESVAYRGRTYRVTSIEAQAFRGCSNLTSVVIPNSVTSIGYGAFEDCSSLTFVVIPNGVTSIGDRTFRGCSRLTYVKIPYSVTTIGDDAFESCSSLTSVVIPNSVTTIGDDAFNCCSSLTSVEIPNSVTTIGDYAFKSCSSLTSVVIGNSVTNIGDYAFGECNNIKFIFNNSGLTFTKGSSSYGYIAYYAKVVCNGYEQVDDYIFTEEDGTYYLRAYIGNNTELVMPTNYKGSNYGIGDYAFSGCPDLTSVEIPNCVTCIGYETFYGCSGLTSVKIPNSVTSIGSHAFSGCSNLKSLTIGAGVLAIGYPQCTPTKTIWLTNTPPNGWSNLKGTINYVANEQYGSSNNVKVYPYLSSIFETDGVTYVPVSPSERTCDAIDCSYDSAVEAIKIGITVSYKGVAMTVKNVMPYVAYEHKTVKKLSVSNLGNIGEQAFYDCTAITQASIFNEGGIGEKAFYRCTGISNATISNEGLIDSDAFRGCTSLATLTLGDGITSIGESAFRECSNLSEVKIPKKVTELGNYCFANTATLQHVELCNNLQKIGTYCFSGSGLESISIPASVTRIGSYAFDDCTKMTDVVIEDRTADLSLGSNGKNPLFADCPLDSVYIGGNISYNTSSSYGYSPFYRNTSLRSVMITDKEEEISDNEFYGCTNLKNVTIGGDVKKIGNWAFSGCSNLDYFSFGKSVKTIGQEAFSDCVNLTKLISYAEVPPTCGTMALDDINKWNCVLQVPQSCLAAYQQADQWKEFFFIEDVLTAIGGVTADGAVPATVDVYSTNGMLIKRNADLKHLKHELPVGIYIINGKKVMLK